MLQDVIARGFPRDLDGHPLLAWMGEDWATFVCFRLYEQLLEQDEGTVMVSVTCLGAPDLRSFVRESGAVTEVLVTMPLELHVRDGSLAEWRLRGTATFTSDGDVSFEIEATEGVGDPEGKRGRLISVLREARTLVERPDNDFTWSSWKDAADALRELDYFIEQVRREHMSTGEVESIFLPTGPMQELALSSGWGPDFLELANRFDSAAAIVADSWDCSVCGGWAGTIEVDASELTRWSFTGKLTQAATEAITSALREGDAAAIHAADAELTPFFCPGCPAVYCGEHMQHWDVFDDGFHDSIRGRCPQGHERMLED